MEKTFGIDNALKVEGAMDPPELEWLARQASTHSKIVEVGCWMGRSTTVLADNTKGQVFAVDTWNGSEEHKEYLKDKPKDFVLEKFRENMKEHLLSRRVSMFRGTSVHAALNMKSAGFLFDMVFIDASHDYESVRTDIELWRTLIPLGGLICGHDYGYPPVTKAVQDCLGHVSVSGTIWYRVL